MLYESVNGYENVQRWTGIGMLVTVARTYIISRKEKSLCKKSYFCYCLRPVCLELCGVSENQRRVKTRENSVRSVVSVNSLGERNKIVPKVTGK